ncbi:ABC transporter ATP-binding protein [Buchananella felis]|uniref:ABC transporter ATP-binding protein n=1 Tax=Buchananella felis TaxID=3231492 RepID=UPI00352966C9
MIKRLLSLLEDPAGFRLMLWAHAVAGFFQGISLAFLVPFLRHVLRGDFSAPAWWWLGVIVACALISLGFSSWAFIRAFAVSSYDVCGTLVRKVGERIRVLPLGWFDASTAGRVTTATTTSLSQLSHLPSMVLPQVTSMTASAVAILGATVFFDWRIGAAMALALPVAWISLRWLARATRAEHEAKEKAMHTLSSRLIEFSQLQPVLRATGQCQEGWGHLEDSLAADHVATDRAGDAKIPPGSLFHAGVQGALLLALGVAIHLLLGGQLEPEVFVALSLMAARFVEPVGMLALFIDPINEDQVALDHICSITDAPTLPEAQSPAWQVAPRSVQVDVRDVTFGYQAGKPVLRDVNLSLPAGTVTAVVGPSGSGKSTLARLVARFWDVEAGSVLVDGVDVRDVPTDQLMELTSMVFQDVYLFDTTIEENVRIGRHDASLEDVHRAAERAGLTEVVERLPQGWQTRVGEGGKSLSGGERQRVALARAFLKDAPILLLDEVTSALDGVNEAAVTAALEDLSRGRTVLVIAHRLSTIRNADRIAVIADGTVEAVGTHDELYAAGGTYRQFWDDQSAVSRWRLPHGGGVPGGES